MPDQEAFGRCLVTVDRRNLGCMRSGISRPARKNGGKFPRAFDVGAVWCRVSLERGRLRLKATRSGLLSAPHFVKLVIFAENYLQLLGKKGDICEVIGAAVAFERKWREP